MKVLIIGSQGFIGQNLLQFYLAEPETEVWGADIIADYNLPSYFYIVDSKTDFNNIFKNHVFDVCINASGAANVSFSIKEPLKDYSLNTLNVFYLLDAIRQYQPDCKFLNLSSAAVYGNPVKLPIQESAAVSPMSPYGWHKWQSEILCREFNMSYGLKTASARIFSVYGEGLRKQLFWDIFCKLKKNPNLELFGTGNESRDFIYIYDLVNALNCIIQHSSFEADIVNVASGVETKISKATQVFLSCFSREIDCRFTGKSKPGDPNNWKADISKLSRMEFHNSFDIDTGLKRYYQWVMKNA